MQKNLRSVIETLPLDGRDALTRSRLLQRSPLSTVGACLDALHDARCLVDVVAAATHDEEPTKDALSGVRALCDHIHTQLKRCTDLLDAAHEELRKAA